MSSSHKDNFNLSPSKRALLEALLKEKNLDSSSAFKPSKTGRQQAPLSFAQERLWFLDQFQPGIPVYNIPFVVQFPGPFNIGALRQSLNEIVRRHETLRTRFEVVDGEPMQVIEPAQSLDIPLLDLREMPETMREAEVQRLAAKEAQHIFDLARGPLFRALVVRVADNDHRLQLNMHHIISDGWSTGVLLNELGVLYDAYSSGRKSPLEELPLQYADFAQQQREYLSGERLAEQLDYWRQELAGAPAVLELPTDRPRPAVQGFRGAGLAFSVSREVTEQLKRISRAEGATLFMTLLAAFKALLYRYSGQKDLVVGTPIANRNRADIEGLIGFFVNTLALRTQVKEEESFLELLRRVQQATLGAYGHQDLPFEKLVEELQPERNLSHNPLFQVMFALQNVPTMDDGPAQSHPQYQDGPKQMTTDKSRFDLSLFMMDKEWGIESEIEYNLDLFDTSTIERLIGHFQQLLRGVAQNPEQRISELPLLSDAERQQLLVEWNQNEAELKYESVAELFEAQVARTPEATAVVFEEEQLSYAELNRRANQVAHYLMRRGVGPEVRVGICLERSLQLAVGLLGILKAGAGYVPLDPNYPRERLAYILEDSQVHVLLTDEHLRDSLFSQHPTDIVCLDLESNAIALEDDRRPEPEVDPNNLGFVIYTSGSTGAPKGVAMGHRSLVNLIHWQINTEHSGRPLKTLQFAAFGFDVFFQEVFSAWCSGGTLVLIPESLRKDPEELLKYIVDAGIEKVDLPPAALRQLAETSLSLRIIPASLRVIVAAGEQLKITEPLANFFTSLRDCTLLNHYGPTETHVVTEHSLKGPVREWPTLPPVGTPIPNARIYILDSRLQPVPIGVPGTLYIGGLVLSRGYLNRPELTAERYIPDPFSNEGGARLYNTGDVARFRGDSAIEYWGRVDFQVKIRGFRVEPGEIENVLEQHEAVKQAVVTAIENPSGDKQLVAYVVRDPESYSVSELLQFMRQRLPDYMIPSTFMEMDSLPLSPNGKVDRRRLPLPEGARPKLVSTLVAPRNPIEETIAGIWQKVLGLKSVGVEDNFFDLGGHSLLATQVMSRVRDAFDARSLPLRRLFETPTIAGLASAVAELQSQQS